MNNSNIPTILTIFGATGDLVAKKVIPALFHLFSKNALPAKFRIIGFSKQELSNDAFRRRVQEIVSAHIQNGTNESALTEFSSLFYYEHGIFETPQHYQVLLRMLEDVDALWGVCSNKLFYLAVPPILYKVILQNLASSGLTRPCSAKEGWTRVLVEKPFGKDLKTSQELDALLGQLFKEVQIYRIDHYLAKEMLQNILAFRFSNNLFEATWNSKLIERIEVRALEKIGVEDRGSFYDDVGALRDVGQNHLLQMVALLTMDQPSDFSADAIREKRAEILKGLKVPTEKETKASTFRAQYQGYRAIKGVKPNSQVETYFSARAYLNAPRWSGVPILLESGKRLGEAVKEAIIILRHPSPCLCPSGKGHYQNKIVMRIEPREAMQIEFWAKKPGLTMDIEKRTLDFHLREKKQRAQYTEEYEKLLLDCIAGDQTLFVSTEEVKSMWEYTDPILDAWSNNAVPLMAYKPDTNNVLAVAKRAMSGALQGTLKREIGIVGLGKMGANLTKRLLEKGWRVIGYDNARGTADGLARHGFVGAYSLDELASRLARPRMIWLMVPAGEVLDEVIRRLLPSLEQGDIIIDGGNSFYKDSIRREKLLKRRGIGFMDVGVSGGPSGARGGASLMIGGDKEFFEKLETLFSDLAVENGYEYVGQAGAGHFVKMVHNGIEYGMMQAIAEGFTILKHSTYKLNLTRIASVYNHGSVIESRLMGWLKNAFTLYGEDLKDVSGSVGHTGEGAWTVQVAREEKVKARGISGALKFRIASEKKPDYTGKILSALRNRFGGHAISS